ncbi:MAG TPA: polysaccharide deacetylase family protein, partial [Steroidobacteraceae bacterium]|nr:polysaccharide deacetylase family protein [Steroidobacteraceae bacterium]
ARSGVTSVSSAVQRATQGPFIRVLYYHDVPPSMADTFACQLARLKRSYVPASKADLDRLLLEGLWPYDRPGLMPTFDDGLRSHAEVVAPILDRLGYQGWFFAPVDLVTLPPAEHPRAADRHSVLHECDTRLDPRVFMTERQLIALSERHIIGCHTATHVRLSEELTDAQLDAELTCAKQRLESILNRRVDSFSWVGGEEWAYSPAAARRVAKLFDYAFTTNSSVARAGFSRLSIDRTHVEAWFSPALVRLQLSGLMDLYYRGKRRRVASAHRSING